MRKEKIITGEYCHIYNRGVDKRDIFNDEKDIGRFIEGIRQFNQIQTIGSLRQLRKSVRASGPAKEAWRPLVSVVVYTLNPNHFHLVLKQEVDGGIAKFLQKKISGYTSYFNVKNGRSGSLFEGPFKAKMVTEENYLRKIIAYANQNNLVHEIPSSKSHLVRSSNHEYETGEFNVVSKEEGEKILAMFGGKAAFQKHCAEIISIIRSERGKSLLEENDDLLIMQRLRRL